LNFSSSLARIVLSLSDFFQQSQHLRFFTSWLSLKQNLQMTLGGYEGRCTDQGGGVGGAVINGSGAGGGPVEADVGEGWGLGAGEEVALTASSTAACGGEGGSGGEDGEEMELGAGAGEEWSGV
jgi:hypothetical protein